MECICMASAMYVYYLDILCPTKSTCIIRHRNNNVCSIDVLDTRLDVMQRVSLCQRHAPYPFQLKFVCDLGSLMHVICNKYVK